MNDENLNNNTSNDDAQRDTAEQIILNRLNQLYDGQDTSLSSQHKEENTEPSMQSPQLRDNTQQLSPTSAKSTSQTIKQENNSSIYQQNYSSTETTQDNTQDWQAYHHAWQDYYKKYYEYYYVQQVKQHQDSINNQPEQSSINPQDSALNELRQKIRVSMLDTATKTRRSQHFWPIFSALFIAFIFLFLQYNRLWIAQAKAYITPAEEAPAIIVTNPTIAVDVGPDPWLIIPKINVKVPVIYNVSSDEKSQQKAMESGVSHFSIPGASGLPGQIGNTILNGHSSSDIFSSGDYRFVFTRLEKLTKNDIIYVDYKGKRYTYIVTKTEVVWPTEINKLTYKVNKPTLTLVTCTPIGSAKQRLLVTAEQISPDPEAAPLASKPEITTKTDNAIPGVTETFLERILNFFN